MDAGTLGRPAWPGVNLPVRSWLPPLTIAVAYYGAAQASFLIGTLSDRVFAPFWPPNVVLFCGLLLTPHRKWWTILGWVFPAHVLAELHVGMSAAPMLLAFFTNCAVSVANAGVLRWFSGPPWFGSIRKAAIYVGATAGVNPAIVAGAGAFVPILGGASLTDYPHFWATWYIGNALASLTLGPIILSWARVSETSQPQFSSPIARHAELFFFAAALLGTCILSIEFSGRFIESAFHPSILYLPLPVILWGAVRFGEKGASTAILVLTVVSIWMTLNGHGPFLAETPERSVVALQLFLVGIATPIILLSAAIDQLRGAEYTKRKLVDSVLNAQDEERRRIARELHDSTAQNLVGVSLVTTRLLSTGPSHALQLLQEADEVLRQSIRDLRVLSYLLHPPLLEDGGLSAAVAKYTGGFSARSGIVVDVIISCEVRRLPRETELVLYRVIQEALINVERHSGSQTARIQISQKRMGIGRVITLTVEDFGRGMPALRSIPCAGVSQCGQGLGLESMRERVQQIGGQFYIASAPGRTIVRAAIPVG